MATENTEPVSPEPSQDEVAGRWSARRKAIVAGAVAVAIVAGIIVAVAIANSNSMNAGGTSQGTNPGSSPTPTEASANPTPSASPSIDPAVPRVPVPIDKPAPISPGLTAAITKFEAVQGEAKTPGEVSGPSVRITVTITNSTSAKASLATAVITAYYGDAETPALELSAPGGSPLPAEIAAGQSATGVYIFTIPVDQRGKVRIMVDYSVDVQPLVFAGAIPG
ncbi:MAG: hypothetical protein JWN09_2703 [Microbacteriaceae bacterium]|jgi:hypothetical protein|nr:hypothetical protein [Microbacteriaceae bacterium]